MLLAHKTAVNRPILMVDSADHVSGKTGLAGGLTITLSKNGGAFSAITPSVVECGTGTYVLSLTASHTDTLGAFYLKVTATGADPTDVIDQVSLAQNAASTMYRGAATGATTTSTLIDSGLTETFTDHWAGRIIIFEPGTTVAKMATQITGFDAATDKLTFVALPTDPGCSPYVIV